MFRQKKAQMMKTTGVKYLTATAIIGISLYLFWKRTQKSFSSSPLEGFINNYNASNNLQEYKPYNSFIEFFDSKNVQEAYDKYKEYLDFGMNEDNAFKSVIENRLDND